MILHAGCVARRWNGGWAGVLITGPSGAGKSDLALRLIGRRGWRLVADDRTRVWTSGGRLYAAAPPVLAGLIEARGLGVRTAPWRDVAPLTLAAACLLPSTPVERLPEPEEEMILGVALRRIGLHALEASAPVKLEQALVSAG